MKMESDKLFFYPISVGLLCFSLMGCQWLNLQNSVGDWGKSRSFMHAGDSAMKTGHYVIAIEQFQQAAELTPDDPVIFERLSESNWELGYQTRAINQMARAVQASDYDASLLYKLANLNFQYGDMQHALEAVNHSIVRDSQLIEARVLRGEIYAEQGASSKALEDLHFVLGILDEDDIERQVEMQMKVAKIYIQQQRFQNVLSIVTTIPITRIDDEQLIQVYQIHSLALQQLGRFKDAQEKLELALKLGGPQIETYYRLAEVHAAANNMPDAVLAIQQTLALSPKHQRALQLSQRISVPR